MVCVSCVLFIRAVVCPGWLLARVMVVGAEFDSPGMLDAIRNPLFFGVGHGVGNGLFQMDVARRKCKLSWLPELKA